MESQIWSSYEEYEDVQAYYAAIYSGSAQLILGSIAGTLASGFAVRCVRDI
jgi:hypothetical protein